MGKRQDKSSWLTIDNIYHVLEVVQDADRKWMVRLLGDESNGPALFRLDEFDIVSSKIPVSWVVVWGKNDFFQLTPEPWKDTGFWERYYDGDHEAIRVFEEERRKIVDADP
jgi:hypothetical protein